MRGWKIAAVPALLAVALSGCASNRYVGTWSGTVQASQKSGGGILGDLAAALGQAALGGQATLTLKLGGTGYLKIGSMPERAITWKADGDKVILSGASASGTETDKSTGVSGELVGTLSSDGQTLTLDLGPVSVALAKKTA